MADRPVHWYEGMFLGPQHLQAAQRHEIGRRQKYARAAIRHGWGLQFLPDLNLRALENHRLEIRSLTAFLRDGTLIDIPDDGSLASRDLRPLLERESPLTVYLALPSYRRKQANTAERGQKTDANEADPTEGMRFLLENQEVEDENTGADSQPIRFRLVNVKLIVSSSDEHPGHDVLPIARIEKSPDADARPRLDPTYIPPVIACDASSVLQITILRALYDRIGTKIDLLAEQVETRGISLESNAAEDVRIMGQLRVLNEAYTVLGVLAFVEGIHPLQAYTELCRVVGQLTLFGGGPASLSPGRFGEELPPRSSPYRAPDLPRYDHDDLGFCFFTVKRYIDALLNVLVEPEWQARPFRGVGKRMQVALEPIWLEPAWQMFVAVDSPLTAEQCVKLFTTPGELDMKIGSSDRVDQIFDYGTSGLAFTHRPQPRALPVRAGMTYFQVDRSAHPKEWQSVKQSMTIALRVNEKIVRGSIDGAQSLTIDNKGKQIPVRLTLYVTRPQT